MLLGPSSLSECFLTRKMDYTGNSISNKISIYLKEFQDFYWEYFAAVFPLWFTAVFGPSCLEYMLALLYVLPVSSSTGVRLSNLKGQISNKAILSSLKNLLHFYKKYKRSPEVYGMLYHIPVTRAGKIRMDI